MSSKEFAKKVEGAVDRREVRDSMTFGVYTIKRRGKLFSLPFVAPTDEVAFGAVKDTSSAEPSLQGSTLFRVGNFCLLDGSLKANRVNKIIGAKNGR